MIVLVNSNWYIQSPTELSVGITLDLILTIPFVYFLLIRKKAIPKLTVVTVFVVGIVVATAVLPESQQSLLSQIKTYVFPIIELGVFSLLVSKAIKIIREFKKKDRVNLDFYNAIQLASKEVFPAKIASLLATEISVIYYGFVNWKKRTLKENEFSYHKNSTIVSVLLGFMLVILIETVAVHLLVEKWSVIAAWVLSILSVYTCLQLFALLRSLSKRPIQINKSREEVILRYGFFSEAVIPIEKIKNIELSEKELPEDKSILPFSPLGTLDGYNCILHLKEEAVFKSFYGFEKKYVSLAFFVDEKQQFKKQIEEQLFTEK